MLIRLSLMFVVGAVAVFGGQFVYWLQVGWWKPLALLDLWTALQIPFPGSASAEAILGWILGFPLSATLVVLSLAFYLLALTRDRWDTAIDDGDRRPC